MKYCYVHSSRHCDLFIEKRRFLFRKASASVEGMNTVFLLLLIVTAANLVLALFVLWHHPKVEVNRVFALTALSVAGWTFTNAIFQQTASVATATQAAAFSYLSAVMLGASFLHFAWIFPRRTAVSAAGKSILWGIAILVGLLSFVPGLVIQTVDISGNRSIVTSAGVSAIAVFMLVTSLWAFGSLLRQHTRLRGIARAQSGYVLTGSALTAVIGLICNLLLPLLGNYSLVWLGPTASLFFVGFIVYSIIAQHLFDIRIIIKRTLVYTILLTAIGAGYSIVETGLTEALRHAVQGFPPWLANVGGAIAVSLCVAPVRDWLEGRLDDLLLGHRHKGHHQGHDRHKEVKF